MSKCIEHEGLRCDLIYSSWYSSIFKIVENPKKLSLPEIAIILNKKTGNKDIYYYIDLGNDRIKIVDDWWPGI